MTGNVRKVSKVEGDEMAKIIKEGLVIPFSCSVCGCSFVVGINVLKSEDGNFYYTCPTCGTRCHTDVAEIPKEYHKAVETVVKRDGYHKTM